MFFLIFFQCNSLDSIWELAAWPKNQIVYQFFRIFLAEHLVLKVYFWVCLSKMAEIMACPVWGWYFSSSLCHFMAYWWFKVNFFLRPTIWEPVLWAKPKNCLFQPQNLNCSPHPSAEHGKAGPKTNELSFRICDQNWWNQENKIENSVVSSFVNPLEGVEYGQKCVESKNGQDFYLKNF